MHPALRPPDDLLERWLSAVLAGMVHMLLAGVLYYGVSWQEHEPEVFEVALVQADTRHAAAPPPPPAMRARPTLPDARRPPPVEAPKPQKVDIAEPEPKPVKKPKPTPEPPKPEEKPKPKSAKPAMQPDPAPKTHAQDERTNLSAMAAREADRLADEKRRQALMRAETASFDAARRKASLAKDEYINSIRLKVRAAIKGIPPGISGNPEAVFLVKQLPSGEVMEVELKRSSGHAVLDDKIKSAILMASPLPFPTKDPSLFKRELELTIRPLEQ